METRQLDRSDSRVRHDEGIGGAIRAFIDALSEDDLQKWETYEQAKALLEPAGLPLFLKRK